MDKLCGGDQVVLDGDVKPGVALQLTSSSKYKPNMNCKVGFRTAQPSQRLIITVEKMDIGDCPSDTLVIYDGATLLNKDPKQQCGSPASYSLTVAGSSRLRHSFIVYSEFLESNQSDIQEQRRRRILWLPRRHCPTLSQ